MILMVYGITGLGLFLYFVSAHGEILDIAKTSDKDYFEENGEGSVYQAGYILLSPMIVWLKGIYLLIYVFGLAYFAQPHSPMFVSKLEVYWPTLLNKIEWLWLSMQIN
jgi:hypothetical protein